MDYRHEAAIPRCTVIIISYQSNLESEYVLMESWMEASREKYIPALNLWMNSIEMVTATLVIKTCLHF